MSKLSWGCVVALFVACGCGAEPSEVAAGSGGAGRAGAGGASDVTSPQLAGAAGVAGTSVASEGGTASTTMHAPDASADASTGPDGGGDGAVPILPALPFECAPDRWQLNAVDVGEVTLHVACRAPTGKQAPLVILLHGYPELHLAWNKLAGPLSEHGFALVAPDQRGFNLSDKPEPVDAYAIANIVADLHGLIEASGRTRVLLVGHDWGGLVSFVYAHEHPERVRGLVILNGPHPDIWGHPEVDPVQGMASEGYVPLLVGPTGALAMPLLDSMLMPYLTPEELEHYRAAWNQPNAFASMNKWYEANVYPEVTMPTGITVSVPTLALWGMDDAFVTPSQLEHLPDYVSDLEIVKLAGVDHWITHQETARLIESIVTFEARVPKEQAE